MFFLLESKFPQYCADQQKPRANRQCQHREIVGDLQIGDRKVWKSDRRKIWKFSLRCEQRRCSQASTNADVFGATASNKQSATKATAASSYPSYSATPTTDSITTTTATTTHNHNDVKLHAVRDVELSVCFVAIEVRELGGQHDSGGSRQNVRRKNVAGYSGPRPVDAADSADDLSELAAAFAASTTPARSNRIKLAYDAITVDENFSGFSTAADGRHSQQLIRKWRSPAAAPTTTTTTSAAATTTTNSNTTAAATATTAFPSACVDKCNWRGSDFCRFC